MPHLEFARITLIDFKEFRGGPHKLDLAKIGLGCHFMSGENRVNPRLGSNGASKSSVWDALCWCLYGRTVSGLRGMDLRTWETKNHPRVLVDVYVDGALMTVTRSTTTNGLWINDKVVTQESVDKLIGLSFATFQHTLYFAQKADTFLDLKSTAKLALLSETLDLDRWEERSRAANKKASDYEVAMSSLMHQSANHEFMISDARKTLDDLKDKSAGWMDEQAAALETKEKNLRLLLAAVERAQLELGNYDLAYDGAETELRHAQRELDKGVNAFSAAAAKYAEMGAEFDAADRERVRLELDLRDMLDGDKCPTCGQTLKGDHKLHAAKARKALKEQTERVKKAKRSWEASGTARGAARMKKERWEHDVRVYRAKSDEAVDGRTRAQGKVQEFKAGYKALNDQTAGQTDNPYSPLISKARTQWKTLINQADECDRLIKVAEQKRERAKYWVKGFRGIRLYLLQEVLDELYAVTQTLLPQIGLDDWEVRFDIERESKAGDVTLGLNVEVMKMGMQKGVKMESWSGGEGQRIRLIGAIALSEVLLRRAGVECDLMILDEVTKHMSPEGVNETIEYLNERGRDNQVFYIDHQAIESSRFSSVVHVVKSDQGARIVIR